MSYPLVPELPRFGSDENDTDDEERPDNSENRLWELFAFPGSSPALQRHMREEEIGLVALSCHFEGWHSFCYSLDLFCSGFEVGVGRQLRGSVSFVDYVSAIHQNSSTGIGRFGREYRGSPGAIPDSDKYTERFANCSRVRVSLLGESEFPDGGSVELNRFWTLMT